MCGWVRYACTASTVCWGRLGESSGWLRVVHEWVSDEVAEVVCVVFCGYFFSGGAQEVFA